MARNLKKLNNNHYLFIERYLENGQNAAEAYRHVFKCDDIFKSSKTGHILINDPLIKEVVKQRQEELRNKYNINKERIIKELVDIIDFNICDIQTVKKIKATECKMNYATGKLEEVEVEKDALVLQQDLDNLTIRQQKNIKSIEQTKTGLKITYYDRMDAIEKLNKLLGLYEEKINIDTTIDTGILKEMNPEELKELLKG